MWRAETMLECKYRASKAKPEFDRFSFINGQCVIYIPDIVVHTIEELVDKGQVEAFGELTALQADADFKNFVVQSWSFEMCDQKADCAPKYTNLDDSIRKGTITLHTHPKMSCLGRMHAKNLQTDEGVSLQDKTIYCANAHFYRPSARDLRTVLEKALMMHIIPTPFVWYVILNNGGEPNMASITSFLDNSYETIDNSEQAVSEFNSLASKIHILVIPRTNFVKGGSCLSKRGDDRCTKIGQREECDGDRLCAWEPLRPKHPIVRFIEGFVCLHLP